MLVLIGYAELVWFEKLSLKSAGFLTMAFSAEIKVDLPPNLSEGFCCLD